MKQTLLLMLCMTLCMGSNAGDDDDFTPAGYSPESEVRLAHKYPHLSTSLEEQDRTFFSNDESKQDYGISLIMFPALVSGICLVCVCCFCCAICFRCCFLGCFNCFKCLFRLCWKDCCRKSQEKKEVQLQKRESRYRLYSKTFPFLLLCTAFAIIWVWVGSAGLNDGVEETQNGMTLFGNIVQSISDELTSMAEAGRRIDAFLKLNTCPPEVSSYLTDIASSFSEFTNTTAQAARVTGSIQPVIEDGSDTLEKYWNGIQKSAFNISAALLFVVVAVFTLGVCMKTAILMRLGILLTILMSFCLCLLVFIEMVVVMGYSDYCMAPTHHIERSLDGTAFDVVHYYSTCDGESPLAKPVDEALSYNALMNETYTDLISENVLPPSCRAEVDTMATNFDSIADDAFDILEFARCPYIHAVYSKLLLEGFCSDSFTGFYNVHVSHLSTLCLFFALMVNAAVLYPHYKGKTLRHLCWCFYTKDELAQADLCLDMNDGVFDGSSSGSESSGFNEEAGSKVMQLEMTEPDNFTFMNPSYKPLSEQSMVRVKVEDEEGQVLGDEEEGVHMDVY